MTTHQMPVSNATFGKIRSHIVKGEQPIEHPYLDLKGNLTIGPGFKTDTEDQFASLNVDAEKNGKRVPATDAKKRQAYRRMMAKKSALGSGKGKPPLGTFNKSAGSYKNDTNIRMSKPAMSTKLDQEIVTRAGDIRKDVGAAAWNKLSPEQQAAITDLHFNTGSLKKFPSLKKAIVAGDAKAMARESLIFTDKTNGKRDHERLSRNYQALSGLSKHEADRGLAAILKNKGEKLPAFLQKPLAEAAVGAETDALARAAKPPAAPAVDFPDEVRSDDPADAEIQQARAEKRSAMTDAPPRQPFPLEPLPAAAPDGEPLGQGVRRVADAVARDAERDGGPAAIKALQTGINLIGQLPNAPALRVDGVAGPRTRRAPRIATARSGPEKVADGVALGRFGAFAEAVQGGRADAGGLTDLVEREDAALALQSAVNGLDRRQKPLRLDGRIGRKTTRAFASILADTGADRVTRRFGRTLGLFT